MAKIPKSPDPPSNEYSRQVRIKGRLYIHGWRGVNVARSWPRSRGKPKSEKTKEQNSLFAAVHAGIKDVNPNDLLAARLLAHGTAYAWRDIMFMAMVGDYIEIPGLPDMSISDQLDLISDVPGSMLYRGLDGWTYVAPPTEPSWLFHEGTGFYPGWSVMLDQGITELTGDVIAGPGSGSQAAELAETGVTPSVYAFPVLQIDAKGRVLDAIDGPVATDSSLGIVQVDGTTIIADPGGMISATFTDPPIATTSVAGLVKPDGTTISVTGDGTISSTGAVPGGPGTGLFSTIMDPIPTIAGLALGTWTAQGTSTLTDITNGVEFVAKNSVSIDDYAYRYAAKPASPFTWDLLVAVNSMTSSDHSLAIGFGDGTKLEFVRAWQSSGHLFCGITRMNSATSWNSNLTGSPAIASQHIVLRIVETSTTVQYGFSLDGESFVYLQTITKSGSFLGASGYVNRVLAAAYSGSIRGSFVILGNRLF